jgi:TM2 domain/Prokaryotic RING finger family 1
VSTAICPYCRGPIEQQDANETICAGCGTPHHADCYAENGGCTVFGCSAGPAEEPKLQLTGSDLANPSRAVPPPPLSTPGSSTVAWSTAPAARVKAPPPPLPNQPAPPPVLPVPRFGSGSVLFGAQPVAAVAVSSPATDLTFDDADNPQAKNRMTFIILGVLLGPLGAHNFFAGYTKKAIAQLCITVLSLGLASPMSWAWAVIDVCTTNRDAAGVQFRS